MDVIDQRTPAHDRSNLREQLSDITPENKTVTEKSEVKRAPESRPYLLWLKFGIASFII